MEEKYSGLERRKAVRLEQDIPVEYNFLNDIKSLELSRKRSGIIRDISALGVRLEADELNRDWIEGLYSGLIKLGIEIKLPGEKRPIRALTKVVWLTKAWQDNEGGLTKYVLGLEFLDITTADLDVIKSYIINSYLEEGNGK